MKAALRDRKNRKFYSIHVWKCHRLMVHLPATYCAGYKLGCPITTDKWIEYEQ
jgi:hypothetical protein